MTQMFVNEICAKWAFLLEPPPSDVAQLTFALKMLIFILILFDAFRQLIREVVS